MRKLCTIICLILTIIFTFIQLFQWKDVWIYCVLMWAISNSLELQELRKEIRDLNEYIY